VIVVGPGHEHRVVFDPAGQTSAQGGSISAWAGGVEKEAATTKVRTAVATRSLFIE
jgi:hypothetical protein